MVVIVYDAPERTIPLAVRSRWVRDLYPTVRVLEAWDGPTEVGYTPELMRAHERHVIGRLGGERITHFYSSEPYGEHVSRALGAEDRRVDRAARPTRSRRGGSATTLTLTGRSSTRASTEIW